jgi:hypothetical protein
MKRMAVSVCFLEHNSESHLIFHPDNADTSKNPRGVRGFALDKGNFSDWKVQGKIGGYTG